MKLDEIASRILAHLKRFEADKKINASKYGVPYYMVNAYRAGTRVGVAYVAYQYHSKLKKADAEAYLAWLDAGNVGTHYVFFRWEVTS